MEENISAHSLAKLKELVLSQRSYERISLLFFFFFCRGWGVGGYLSNRFKITGFKFLNVKKCLKNGDVFLKSLACVRFSESTGTGWLVKTQIYLWCIKGRVAGQPRDFVYNRES